jgi:hypothetical protein
VNSINAGKVLKFSIWIMAHSWRIEYEVEIYHIMSRGVGMGEIIVTKGDYIRLLAYVEKDRR